MADWNRLSKKNFLENLYKGQNLKVRKFQIHRTLESKVIKRKPTGGHIVPPPVLIGLKQTNKVFYNIYYGIILICMLIYGIYV